MSNKRYAVFTMDVERFSDTECLSSRNIKPSDDMLDGFDEYIKILDKYGIKSTLFTVGDLAPEIADKLKSCIQRGHKVALHSYSHIAPIQVHIEQFKKQIAASKAYLQTLLGSQIIGFRAPCFSLDKERLNVLRELDFRYDSSHLDFKRARHTVSLDLSEYGTVKKGIYRQDGFYEFSLSKQSVFGKTLPISGGGYVRLGNWGFTKYLIDRYIRKNDYYVFYLHPFELTKHKIPFIKQLKNYDKYYLKAGIPTYGRKVEAIIKMLKRQGYEFITFEELYDRLEGNKSANAV